MCLYPKYLDLPNNKPTLAQPYSRIHAVVPCGKCIECLKQRQSNFATRIYLEGRKCKKMFFVTLTYNNDALPLAMRVARVDKVTGEVSEISPYLILDNDTADVFRPEISALPATSSARYVYRDICEFDNYLWQAQITPSLNRKDVRNYLKKRRIQYERAFGEKLPDFTYAFCGEYGPRGGRPHYHALFMGLDYEQLSWLLLDWNLKYGYTYTKEIPILNPDGSDARLIVSRYVGKYIAKGKFDLDACLRGDCEKGRLCNSIGLGNTLTDEEISYYRCYDLFGEYHIDTLQLLDGSYLGQEQINVLCKEISARSHINLGINAKTGKPINLSLPQFLKRKIFCIRDSYYDKVDKKTKVRYVGSVISSKVADFTRCEFVSRNREKFKKIRPDLYSCDVSLETYYEMLCFCKSSSADSKSFTEEIKISRQYFSNEKDNQ